MAEDIEQRDPDQLEAETENAPDVKPATPAPEPGIMNMALAGPPTAAAQQQAREMGPQGGLVPMDLSAPDQQPPAQQDATGAQPVAPPTVTPRRWPPIGP